MFEITGDNIAALNDADLRTLIARLAAAELGRQGLPISGVTAGGNQDAADGGLDVRVEVPSLPAPDFVPRSKTGFQVKRPNMTASAIGNEMKPNRTLRPVIGELADAGGAYIIFSAQGSVADGPLNARRQAMREAVAGHPNGSALLVDFYDRDRVANWASQFPGVAVWIRARLGRELSGWRPVGDWADGHVANGKPYLQNDHACLIDERSKAREKLSIGDGIVRLREALSTPRQAVRLIGLSGFGKTRLVQALFETGVGDPPLDPALAVYTDYSEQTNPSAREMARRLVDLDQRAILVVDNCNPATHAELANICAGDAGKVSLITVEYDVRDDEPERTDVFRLEHASPALVEEWLEQNFGYVSQVDRGRISTFSDGNFRVARALADTLRRGENLGQLRDRQLFERIFHQRNAPDQQLMFAAEDLSLLYSFDGEDTSPDGELAIIGAIRAVSASGLYGHVAELKRRGIVQSRGRWRAILPHAIANPLASYALQRIPPADFDRFCVGLPARMLKSVSRRIGYLHDDATAGATVARWLQADGPLGDLFALGGIGLEILHNIAPVAPASVMAKIEVELGGPNGARILATDNRERGQWISLIKTLGYDTDLFEVAAVALARFVAAEQGRNTQNSATSMFGELFQMHLSGTQARPDQRRTVIRHMAESNDPALRTGAVRALDSLLEASHFTSLSNHDFGARPRDFGWRPPTYGDIWDWYIQGVSLAVELSASLPAAAKVLADNVRGIWRYPRCQDALEEASDELSRNGLWIDGWIGFRQSLAYDAAEWPPENRARLVATIERLKPTDLLNRARAIVLARSGGGFDVLEDAASSPSDAWRLAAQQAVDLGRAFANEPDLLAIFLPELLAETSPHRAFEFGKGLAEGAVTVAEMWETLLAAFRTVPRDGRNATVLGGYIHGATLNPQFVANALDGVADDPELAGNLTYLQARAGIDREGISRLSEALRAGKIEPIGFRQLATGVVSSAPGDALAPLLTQIAAEADGSSIALEILHMHFACAASDGHAYDTDLISCGRRLLAVATFGDNHSLADYGAGEVAKVCLADVDSENAARVVCLRVRNGLDSYELSAYRIGHLLKALFAVQPHIALDSFLLGDGDVEYRLERRSPLNDLDADVMRAWAEFDPADRYPRIGRLLSIFDVDGLEDVVGLSAKFVDLLEHAPDRAAFLGDPPNRLYPSGWSGSLADVLERRRATLAPLVEHHDPAVRSWMVALDSWLEERIATERQRDMEREESFE